MNAEALLELQLADTAIDQLRNRMGRLPEVLAEATATAELAAWHKRAALLRTQISAHENAIAVSETQSAAISTKRARLEQQLKTVISPREAEALMHEIDTLNAQRSVLDDGELEAMDAVAAAEAELESHHEGHDDLHGGATAATELADQARATAETELAERVAARDGLRSGLSDAALHRYDDMRKQLGGVAVAKLNGLRCEGCHLDMSRGEVDDLKRDQSDEVPECPNCGRLLVR